MEALIFLFWFPVMAATPLTFLGAAYYRYTSGTAALDVAARRLEDVLLDDALGRKDFNVLQLMDDASRLLLIET